MASKAVAKQHWRSDMLFFLERGNGDFGAAMVASIFSRLRRMSSGWYESLTHASWTPPRLSLFSLAWTILYVFIAVAIFPGRPRGWACVRQARRNRCDLPGALSIAGLLLNVGWCMGFFASPFLSCSILAQTTYSTFHLPRRQMVADGQPSCSLPSTSPGSSTPPP